MPDDKNTQQTQDNTNSTNKNNTSNEQNSAKTEAKQEDIKTEQKNNTELEPEPTLEEDYEALKQMNLLRNIMIRMQYGRYPNKKIEAILKRRMDFDYSKYQGTHIVRIIISIMATFFICTFIYIIIWLIASSMNLNDLKETSSIVISMFFLGASSFTLFNNISVPDEKKLKETIKNRMTELESELKIENKGNNNDNNRAEKQS